MALGKSPQRRKVAAPSADAPSSPGRLRKSAPVKTVSAKGKAKAGQTRQQRTLTVDIPAAPFLGNFLSPLDYAVVEQVSYSSILLAAGCRTPVAASLCSGICAGWDRIQCRKADCVCSCVPQAWCLQRFCPEQPQEPSALSRVSFAVKCSTFTKRTSKHEHCKSTADAVSTSLQQITPCSVCHLDSLSSEVPCLQDTSGRKDVASQLAKQQRKALLLQQVNTVAQTTLAWPLRRLLFT